MCSTDESEERVRGEASKQEGRESVFSFFTPSVPSSICENLWESVDVIFGLGFRKSSREKTISDMRSTAALFVSTRTVQPGWEGIALGRRRPELCSRGAEQVNKLRSIRTGELKLTRDGQRIKTTLPVESVRDSLAVQ